MASKKNQTTGLPSLANPERAKAAHELRRSSAAQPHVPVPRKGTRESQQRRAVIDQIQE